MEGYLTYGINDNMDFAENCKFKNNIVNESYMKALDLNPAR